jgi:hypothetical protein
MKRICILALVVAVLAGCSGNALSGSYKSEDNLLGEVWTFSSNYGITISAIGGVAKIHGEYALKGDSLTVTRVLLGVETTATYTLERRGKDLIIDGVRFVRQ